MARDAPNRFENSMPKTLNQFEAAFKVGLSPELLMWCTSYAVKTGETRKLAVAANADGTFHFDESELLDY